MGNPVSAAPRGLRLLFAAVAAAVLFLALVSATFTDKVAWGAADYGAAAILLASTWIAIEVAWRFLTTRMARTVALIAIVLALLAMWAHLAVDIWH